MIRIIEDAFLSFGFTPIETPALEYSEILLGKGSEETDKQLYRFNDNGDRDVSLRFDLTIPLARFSAMHMHEVGTPFKRYQIAPVWRAEKPQRGRYREFYQCDIDILGSNSELADAEVIAVIDKALNNLDISHKFRINNRKILAGLLEDLNISDKSQEVLRAIDKLDKLGKEVVEKELREITDQTESIFSFLEADNDIGELKKNYSKNETSQAGVNELEKVVLYLEKLGVNNFELDLSIARGLDYYTGTIFETEFNDMPEIGSISSGGRYDNLTGLYSKQVLAGVGGSIGLDRILGAFEELGRISDKNSTAKVLVCNMHASSIVTARSLRDAGIATELYFEEAKLAKQLKYANQKGIGIVVIAGRDEVEKGVCGVKNLENGDQVEVELGELIKVVKQM